MEIDKQIQEVLEKHSNLTFCSQTKLFTGEIAITGDSYQVEIDIKPYPRLFPKVFETGGRIPKKADRHIYENTGACCFTTPAYSQILLKTKVSSLLIFIDEVVVKYLENNSYYEIHQKYYSSKYAHGVVGIIQGYRDILGIQNLKIILDLIQYRLNNNELRKKSECYCGSGRKLFRCGSHLKNWKLFLLIEEEILKNDYNLLYKNVI